MHASSVAFSNIFFDNLLKYSLASSNYEAFFQNGLSSEGDEKYMYEKDNHDQVSEEANSNSRNPSKPRSLTGIVWDKTKYEGTPLQVGFIC